MNEGTEEQRDHIIENLERLNSNVARQLSVRHIFMTGMIYGVGFVIGSSILAAVVVGILSPILDDIPFLQKAVEMPYAKGYMQ